MKYILSAKIVVNFSQSEQDFALFTIRINYASLIMFIDTLSII